MAALTRQRSGWRCAPNTITSVQVATKKSLSLATIRFPLVGAGQTTLATFSLYVALAIPAREQNLYMDFKLQNELRDAGYNGGFLLEELIEAIIKEKSNTFSVYFNEEWSVYEEPNKDGPWSARYYNLTPVGFYECGAKTPTEAVARLWLSLHQNKRNV